MKSLEEDKQFVEEIGVILDNFGLTGLQSRIVAFLILKFPEGVTFDELVDFLGASKSSISNNLKYLLDGQHIVYFTKPGERKRYFKIQISLFWLSEFEQKAHSISSMIGLVEKHNKYKMGVYPEFEEMSKDFIEFLKRIQTIIINEIKIFKERK